jgi:hypothetical protein
MMNKAQLTQQFLAQHCPTVNKCMDTIAMFPLTKLNHFLQQFRPLFIENVSYQHTAMARELNIDGVMPANHKSFLANPKLVEQLNGFKPTFELAKAIGSQYRKLRTANTARVRQFLQRHQAKKKSDDDSECSSSSSSSKKRKRKQRDPKKDVGLPDKKADKTKKAKVFPGKGYGFSSTTSPSSIAYEEEIVIGSESEIDSEDERIQPLTSTGTFTTSSNTRTSV